MTIEQFLVRLRAVAPSYVWTYGQIGAIRGSKKGSRSYKTRRMCPIDAAFSRLGAWTSTEVTGLTDRRTANIVAAADNRVWGYKSYNWMPLRRRILKAVGLTP